MQSKVSEEAGGRKGNSGWEGGRKEGGGVCVLLPEDAKRSRQSSRSRDSGKGEGKLSGTCLEESAGALFLHDFGGAVDDARVLCFCP